MKKILIVLGVFFLINVIKFNIYAKEDNISSEISDTVAEGNEYAFMAETEEEAQAIAKYYNATLLSFEYGVGSIYIDKNNQAQTAFIYSENSNMIAAPKLYPEIIYELDVTDEEGDALEQWHVDSLKMNEVWDYSQGENVVVAVIDTGIDTDHVDIKDSIYRAISVVPEEQYGDGGTLEEAYKGPQDYFGHGTHVAGIIAADDDNDGCVGIAPKSKIMSIKALEKKGTKGTGKTSWVVAGINAAIEAEVDIINMSIGGTSVKDELLGNAVKNALDNDILVVCAAGNITGGNAKVFYPAAYDGVIAVSAVKKSEDSVTIDTSYSNYGSFVDIAAPGSRILSPIPDNYGYKSGTSMACPVISGAAALLLSKKSDLTNAQICELMYDTAIDMGDSGRDDYYGNGVVDLVQMMEAYMEVYEPESAEESSSTEESSGNVESSSTEESSGSVESSSTEENSGSVESSSTQESNANVESSNAEEHSTNNHPQTEDSGNNTSEEIKQSSELITEAPAIIQTEQEQDWLYVMEEHPQTGEGEIEIDEGNNQTIIEGESVEIKESELRVEEETQLKTQIETREEVQTETVTYESEENQGQEQLVHSRNAWIALGGMASMIGVFSVFMVYKKKRM